MRVFDFTLLSGYEFSGVDVAQGFRARLFAKNNVNAKFIFTELPTIRDMELYGSQKIKRGQIMSAHLFMTGRLDMSLSVKKEALLENEKENYEYDNIDEDGKVIRLYNSGEKSVEILCDEDGFVINESLFKNGKKYLENYYTDSLSYTELYNWDNDSNDGLNLGRRIFWNKQGQMVYEQCIYKDNVEYLFKNGEVIDNVEFLERFVKTLNLCFVDHAVTRCFHFAGNYNRFPFLAEYHGKTPIYQYDANKPDRENDDSFCWRGYFEQEKLMHELSKGGFGLVWSDDEYFDRYYSMNQPYKLGTNLAAGIPVIVKRGCVHEKFVERNGLGYAVDTLDEADKLVQSITDAEYIKLYHNVKNIQKLILDGAYTRKTLQDAIIEVLENACTPVENRYQDHI